HPAEPLAGPDAQRHRGVAPARLLQLARDREREARARGAERMADRDRAAVRVDARVLEVDLHEPQAAERLACEGFVDFDDIHVFQLQPCSLESKRYSVCRPDAHDAWLDAGARRRHDARDRLLAFLLAPLAAADGERSGTVIRTGGVARAAH